MEPQFINFSPLPLPLPFPCRFTPEVSHLWHIFTTRKSNPLLLSLSFSFFLHSTIMKLPLQLPSNLSTHTTYLTLPRHFTYSTSISPPNSTFFLNPSALPSFNRRNSLTLCSLNSSTELNNSNSITEKTQFDSDNQSQFLEIKNPNFPLFISSWRAKFSLSDQAFFLLTFIACTTSVAFVSFVAAAVPTLYLWPLCFCGCISEGLHTRRLPLNLSWAMGRAANSFAKLAETARAELPSTMAAIRLSGMEVSDLTVELSDLRVEMRVDGKRAALPDILEAMIEERANLPVISLQPVVSGAAKKTSRAVGHATRTLLNLISGGESMSGENE
ncbi:Ribosome biogenesis protein bms1 [Bienertia sinuspersici]